MSVSNKSAKYNIQTTKRGVFVFSPDAEIIAHSISKEQAALIVETLNGDNDMQELVNWLTTTDGEKVSHAVGMHLSMVREARHAASK